MTFFILYSKVVGKFFQSSPFFRYSVIILDEAHERTLATDVPWFFISSFQGSQHFHAKMGRLFLSLCCFFNRKTAPGWKIWAPQITCGPEVHLRCSLGSSKRSWSDDRIWSWWSCLLRWMRRRCRAISSLGRCRTWCCEVQSELHRKSASFEQWLFFSAFGIWQPLRKNNNWKPLELEPAPVASRTMLPCWTSRAERIPWRSFIPRSPKEMLDLKRLAWTAPVSSKNKTFELYIDQLGKKYPGSLSLIKLNKQFGFCHDFCFLRPGFNDFGLETIACHFAPKIGLSATWSWPQQLVQDYLEAAMRTVVQSLGRRYPTRSVWWDDLIFSQP